VRVGWAVLLREQILIGIGQIQLTLPAYFEVFSYQARSDLTQNFICESEINFSSMSNNSFYG
jgi:hypothetical protein